MEKTVRVGVMPGRIQEFVVEEGTSIKELLEMAGLNHEGYDVKIDGEKVNPDSAIVTASTNLVLLAKQVKGNSEKTVRVGVMPGRIQEYAVEVGTPVKDLLDMAGLNPAGYDVKIDGEKVDPNSATVTSTTNLVLLAKQVKGN